LLGGLHPGLQVAWFGNQIQCKSQQQQKKNKLKTEKSKSISLAALNNANWLVNDGKKLHTHVFPFNKSKLRVSYAVIATRAK
jgi:hypothetical protein